MQLSGMLHGAKLLRFVDFPVPEVLGPDASEDEIKALIDRHGMRVHQAGLQGRRSARRARPGWSAGPRT